jgi:Spy/CpxP family protein refolding chaperone
MTTSLACLGVPLMTLAFVTGVGAAQRSDTSASSAPVTPGQVAQPAVPQGQGRMGPAQGPRGRGPGQMGPGAGVGRQGRGRGGPGGMSPRGPDQRPVRGPRLDLTEEQRTSIEALQRTMRDQTAGAEDELELARRTLHREVFADKRDNARISNLTAKVASLEKQLADLRLKTQTAVADLLTPAQREAMRLSGHGAGRGMRSGRGMGGPARGMGGPGRGRAGRSRR